MAVTEAGLIANLTSVVDGVAGMAKATVPFAGVEAIPANGLGSWFYVVPRATGDQVEVPDGTNLAAIRLDYDVVFGWDVGLTGDTGLAGAQSRARLIRETIDANEPFGDARVLTGQPDFIFEPGGRVVEIRIPVEAHGLSDFS